MATPINEKGLTNFQLKYLAAAFMLLDHIEYIFEFTGVIPIAFSYIGRLAAPLFLFCLIEGFKHTHDRKKYFLKIYLISIGMGLIRFGFMNVLHPLVRGDGFAPQNAMLSSFVILIPILQGIDWCREKKFVKGLLAIILPLALPYIMMYGVYTPLSMLAAYETAGGMAAQIGLFIASLLNYTALPLHSMIQDGGILIVLQGVVLFSFSFCKNRNVRVYAYVVFTLLWFAGMMLLSGISINFRNVIEYYEWMEVLAAPLMLCYNGERGHGNGKFFYWFYPVHIYVLYALSVLVYNVIAIC